jgi:hypothetical protein
VRVTDCVAATAEVEAEKLAEKDPAGIVTDAGKLTAPLLSDSATVTPPAGAGPDSTTVQVLEAPPVTVAGLQFKEDKLGVPEEPELTMVNPVPVTSTPERFSKVASSVIPGSRMNV